MNNPGDVFARHRHVAFQLSGGRDSVAALHMMREWIPRMTVYFADLGDSFPETLEVINQLEQRFGFTSQRVTSDSKRWRSEHGDPTDVLPVAATPFGRMLGGGTTKLCSAYECCAYNKMIPMHQRMLADGITCIVRGVRHGDYVSPPTQDGSLVEGFEFCYPIWSWDAEMVDSYIRANDLPQSPWYKDGALSTRECLSCTAYWWDGRQSYMRRHHPQVWQEYRAKLVQIKAALEPDMALLTQQLAE
jgi:phosphoadenosine phosphosulfate reductase